MGQAIWIYRFKYDWITFILSALDTQSLFLPRHRGTPWCNKQMPNSRDNRIMLKGGKGTWRETTKEKLFFWQFVVWCIVRLAALPDPWLRIYSAKKEPEANSTGEGSLSFFRYREIRVIKKLMMSSLYLECFSRFRVPCKVIRLKIEFAIRKCRIPPSVQSLNSKFCEL